MLKFFIDSCQELVFPSFCLECSMRLPCREMPLLCRDCLARISYIHSPRCMCCGIPFETGHDHLCGLCLKHTYAFDLARSAIHYREPVTSLISSLKFSGALAGLKTLAHLATNSPGKKDLSEPDILVPVPLHRKRLRERQFNQAMLIALTCYPEYKKKVDVDILARQKATPPQTGLSGLARRKNLAGAFTARKPDSVRNKNILIIDDVFTTGSTVDECAKVLRKAGAKRIEVFTLARAI